MEAPGVTAGLTIPMVGVPLSIGRSLLHLLNSTGSCSGCGVRVRFGPDAAKGLPSYEVRVCAYACRPRGERAHWLLLHCL